MQLVRFVHLTCGRTRFPRLRTPVAQVPRVQRVPSHGYHEYRSTALTLRSSRRRSREQSSARQRGAKCQEQSSQSDQYQPSQVRRVRAGGKGKQSKGPSIKDQRGGVHGSSWGCKDARCKMQAMGSRYRSHTLPVTCPVTLTVPVQLGLNSMLC